MITIIVAVSENYVIGNKGKIPWRLPRDFKHFKQSTLGHPIVMGRKTYESIGKPLPNRENIILTKQNIQLDGCTIMHSIDEVIIKSKKENVFIIGGAEIYKQFLTYTDKIIMTIVHTKIDGDTFFPKIDKTVWEKQSSKNFEKDIKNNFNITIEVYEKK